MAVQLQPDDFNRLVNILNAQPMFMSPLTRLNLIYSFLQGSPRVSTLMSSLNLGGGPPRNDAVSIILTLTSFGQDIPGRAVLTLLIRGLLEMMGEGDDAAFLRGLLERYSLEQIGDSSRQITILFMTANPTDTARLRIDAELRDIDIELQKSRYRERFTLKFQLALRVADLQGALLHHQPQIVHFSGHGIETEALVFEDDAGMRQPVPPEALADLFKQLDPPVQCVVLNACHSAPQAERIVQHVKCVVGMARTITDRAALQFATAFYRALGYGLSVQKAYDLGCNQIGLAGLKETTTPTLQCNPSVDPAQLKLIG